MTLPLPHFTGTLRNKQFVQLENLYVGTPLEVRWLRHYAFTAGVAGLTPSAGSRIPRAMCCSLSLEGARETRSG